MIIGVIGLPSVALAKEGVISVISVMGGIGVICSERIPALLRGW